MLNAVPASSAGRRAIRYLSRGFKTTGMPVDKAGFRPTEGGKVLVPRACTWGSITMKNKEVAEALYEISEMLVLKNENVFKVRAYERASEIVASLPEPIEYIADKNSLTSIPGIGEGIAEKIQEYLRNGNIAYLKELKANFPEGLFEIMKLQGMGPKKAR